MEDNINAYKLVVDKLNSCDMWFTTKNDPTINEAPDYYKLDEYGEPTDTAIKKIENEVNGLIGDGAVDLYDAVELWVNDALVSCKIDYKDNLVTVFKDRPVVDNIEAYENPVQFPMSKKVESILKNIQIDDEIDEWKVYSADVDTYLGKDIIASFKNYEDDDSNVITNIRIDYNTKTGDYIVNYVDNNGRFHEIDYKLSSDELEKIKGTKKVEVKSKKTEGAGAGYEISGSISDAHVNSFDIVNVDRDKYNERVVTLNCDVDVSLNDLYLASYYYGDKLDFPIKAKITSMVMIDNDTYEDDEPEINDYNINDALNGTTFKEVLGGGWIHSKFEGTFESDAEGNVSSSYFYTDKVTIKILSDSVVEFIDLKVSGEVDNSTYEVFDIDSDILDSFDDEAKAIEFAKNNKGVQVVQVYHNYSLSDEEGSVDDDPNYEIVWERDYDKNYRFNDDVQESKKVENIIRDDGTEVVDDNNSGFTYAKIFVDFFVNNKENADVEVDKFLDRYLTELSNRDITIKSMLNYLDDWNYHTYVGVLEDRLNSDELTEAKVKGMEDWKSDFTKDFQAGDLVTDEIVQEFRNSLPPVTDRQNLVQAGEPYSHDSGGATYTTFRKVGKYWRYEGEKHKIKESNGKINGDKKNVNFKLCTKDKVDENYQKRLDEVNNKSKGIIDDMVSKEDFDENSAYGKIVMRTANMFNVLSDNGYDVDVTFDNGESTSAIQLGPQGGKITITITDSNKPLKAFTAGNFEVNDDIVEILKDVQNILDTL